MTGRNIWDSFYPLTSKKCAGTIFLKFRPCLTLQDEREPEIPVVRMENPLFTRVGRELRQKEQRINNLISRRRRKVRAPKNQGSDTSPKSADNTRKARRQRVIGRKKNGNVEELPKSNPPRLPDSEYSFYIIEIPYPYLNVMKK